MTVREDGLRFSESSSLRPFDRVETEIVAQLRVGACVHQYSNEVCVTEDYREDESRPAAVRAFIYVRTISQQRRHSTFVAGSNGVGQRQGRTHRTIPS
jgi:hypothetical protein